MTTRSMLPLWALLLLVPSAVFAQVRTKSSDGEPCCNVTAINAATGLVTAQGAGIKSFQFRVRDAALLRTIKVGQSVYADFATGKVRLHGAEPCCSIVTPSAADAARASMDPGEPCCSITAVNNATAIVTAVDQASGRSFRFEVKDAALLRTLKVGQKVFADFGSSKVRIHGAEPCCAIIGHGVGGN